MITASTAFATAVEQDSRSFLAKILLNGTELDCSIRRIETTKGSAGGSQFGIGQVIGSKVIADVAELTTDVKGQDISVQIGVLTDVENDTYEFITVGHFMVAEVKKTTYNTTLTGYGYTVTKTRGAFTPPTVQTLANIASEIGTEMGCTVTLDSAIDGTKEITASMAGLTTYGALVALVNVVGGYAVDTADGNLAVYAYNSTATVSKDAGMCNNLPDLEEANFTVTGVKCTTDNGTVYTNGTDINLEFTSGYMTQDLFTALASRVIGYTYRAGTIDLSLGDPRIEGSDVVAITDVDESVYNVPCHTVVHTYDGGFKSQINALRATNEADDIGSIPPLTTKVEKAITTATRAIEQAESTNQYFWHTETDTGAGAGAHITEIPQSEFLDDPANGGGNLLARSDGIAVRDGMTELATFGTTGAQIGVSSGGHTIVQALGLQVYGNDGTVQLANVGFGAGNSEQGTTTNAPYYTLGERSSGSIVGNYSMAEGKNTVANQYCSHAEGSNTTANGAWAHAEGNGSQASGQGAHAEGIAVTGGHILASGNGAHAEGIAQSNYSVIASGGGAHAEGVAIYGNSEASGQGSHVEGSKCTASEFASHAEGSGTTASANDSHAEGWDTVASGTASHAEGWGSTASGNYSHAEGEYATAQGQGSHASGLHTSADSKYQTVIGKYNESDTNDTYALIIGNGQSNTSRNNAFEVGWNGNATLAGTLTQSSDRRLKKHRKYLDKDAIEFVQHLVPAFYEKDGEDHIGFYAQDVEKVDPWHCLTGQMNGYKTLDYIEIIAPLVRYCQHLEERIAKLEREVAE